jgi:hypothetical protein
MTPKDKAEELVDKYYYNDLLLHDLSFIQAKQSALIAVDEIHNALKQSFNQIHEKTEMTADLYLSESISVHYYQEVKKEIEKL